MLELAKLVIELTGSKSKIVHLPRPTDDPSQRRPDITLAKKHLNWEPKVPLREGLAKTIEYFKSIDLKQFRKPTDHTAHKSMGRDLSRDRAVQADGLPPCLATIRTVPPRVRHELRVAQPRALRRRHRLRRVARCNGRRRR